MAEGDCTVYQSFIVGVLSADIDCTTGPFWMTLHTGLSINQAHETYADVDGVLEYGTAGGYTVGGKVCATPTVTKAAAIKFDADDPATWTALLLPSHAVLRYKVPGNTTDPLVCIWVLGTTNTNGGDYTLSFNAAGILTITA
jgi:hypothetical protein